MTMFDVPEKVEIAQSCMVHGPQPRSQKIRLTPESFQKCEALRYRVGAKQLLTACRVVCFAMFFGPTVELRIFPVSEVEEAFIRPTVLFRQSCENIHRDLVQCGQVPDF
ncbi:hypothetical protein TNCV_2150051 [Trichonephila clavipes]|nr:hypothetical protein TNCV_2150051 [Trichonephila clavipes]